jgi:hypothetical protein
MVHEPNTMDYLGEDAGALLRAAHEIHAERHGVQTFTHQAPTFPWKLRDDAPASARTGSATTMPSRIWSTRVPSSGTRARDTPGGKGTTSSPGAAWIVLSGSRVEAVQKVPKRATQRR